MSFLLNPFRFGAPGYSLNEVDTNGTAELTTTAAPGNSASFELSTWIRRNGAATGTWLAAMNASAQGVRFFIDGSGGSVGCMRWIIMDSANTAVYIARTTNPLTANQLYHFYFSIDLAGPTATVLLDGVAVALTDIVALNAGNGTIKLNEQLDVGHRDGNDNGDVTLSDLFFEAGAINGYANFHDAGQPKSLIGLGSPFLFLGDAMTADERAGNAGEGWNDGFNLGSASLSVGSATFTDL